LDDEGPGGNQLLGNEEDQVRDEPRQAATNRAVRPVQREARSIRRWNRSTWPAVSTMFCVPVKKGWQFEQTSTRIDSEVDPTMNVVPHAQWTWA
jgi:hypothetical protein